MGSCATAVILVLLVCWVPLFTTLTSARGAATTSGGGTLWFVSEEASNDLLGVAMAAAGPSGHVRNASLAETLQGSDTGDSVLLLAGGYPWRRTEVPRSLLRRAAELRLRLYLEFPDSLDGFDLTPAPASATCANSSAGRNATSVMVDFLSTERSLCACEGATTPSTIRFTGSACGGDGKVLWNAMRNMDPCADCKGKTCNWTRSGEPTSWSTQWLGGCGVAPTAIPQLPMHLCGLPSPTPHQPPPPPPSPTPSVKTSWQQRGVITSTAAAAFGLDFGQILLPQGSHTTGWCADQQHPLSAGCAEAFNRSLMSLAKVAGVYNASFGVPRSIQQPILFEHTLNNLSWHRRPSPAAALTEETYAGPPPKPLTILVATTKLSNMISGRYGPKKAWHSLWSFLLHEQLGLPTAVSIPEWELEVAPAFPHPIKLPQLPAGAAAAAVRNSAAWLVEGSDLLSDGSNPTTHGATTCCTHRGSGSSNMCAYHACSNADVCPPGKGRVLPASVRNLTCIQEGWSSILHWNGSQHRMATFIRTDGNSETSMGLALAAAVLPPLDTDTVAQREMRAVWLSISVQLADYLWRWSDSQSTDGAAATAGDYGIVWWNQQTPGPYSQKWASVDYGDNAANVLIGGSATRALANTSSWDLQLLRCLMAEARTTGVHGFRPSTVPASQVRSKGWETFFNSSVVPNGGPGGSQPHYGAYLPAYFLWAGQATGLSTLLTKRAVSYCTTLMAGYLAGEWEWNESISNEQARFLLNLAWLVRVDDTPLHRQWLRRMAGDLIRFQDNTTGAIRQMFGTGKEAGKCSPCAPRSNAEYGSGEGPILDHTGNQPISDSLYTLSFALAGLREAYGATGEVEYARAESKLVEFLVRTQVKSAVRPELSGAWFRAFDYDAWDYWASDNDWGYGPWTTETGWSNGWIMTALAAREGNTTVWDVMSRKEFEPGLVASVCREMLPAEYCVVDECRSSKACL